MSFITTETTTLHNGVIIPALGYRVDKDHGEDNYQRILTAIKAGFRHFDIACDSQTEKIFARAMADSGIPRFEFFLTLKLANDDHGYDRTLRAFDHAAKRIGTDYADLYLVDWPNPVRYRDSYEETAAETWKAMETLYKNGKVHAIGLANFEARHIEFCLEKAEIAPMFNQARIYPGFPFSDNLNCADEHDIITEGFLPPLHDAILSSKELDIFAKKYHTSPRNICIAYLFHKGCLALCQGDDEQELRDCRNAFSIQLSDDDIHFMNVMKNYGPENINPDTCDF